MICIILSHIQRQYDICSIAQHIIYHNNCFYNRLEDLYENIVLETQGDRILPLVTNPGRIMLTSQRLYFQPFNNIEKVRV